jgi:hypothetical protein
VETMYRKWSFLIAAALCACCGMNSARAQNISGAMLGNVTDQSGAPMSGAEITITSVATNRATRLTTNLEGYFEASLLPPGGYSVKAAFSGFKTVLRDNIQLQVESRLRLDFALEIGEASTTISVSGEAPLVESETASLGQVVASKVIEDLPIKGRNVFDLAILSPGVQVNPRALGAVASTGDNDAPLFVMSDISINGGRYRTNDYLLDGVSIMLPENNNFALSPTPDGTLEFKVMTNSYGPQFGRSGGGVINVVTRSGSNQWHGTAYEFFRNDLFKANNYFANATRQARGPQHFNLFGATLGGPVAKNKTFLFAEYQGSRSLGALAGMFATLPTDAQRKGDFSSVRNQSGQAVTIYDPFNPIATGNGSTRLPFAGNRVPSERQDRVALKMITYVPLPNNPGTGPAGVNNYVWQQQRVVDNDQWSVRIDHRFSERQTLFIRTTRNTGLARDTGPFNTAADNVAGPTANRVVNAVLNDTYVLSPTAVLNLRYGLTRRYEGREVLQGAVGLANLGFPASFAANAGKQNFPGVSFTGYTNWGATAVTIRRGNDIHTWVGDETLIRGRHTIVYGADVRLYNQTPYQESTDSGSFSFTPSFTQGPNSLQASLTAGDAFASFLTGYGGGSITTTPALAIRNMYYAVYVNDQIRFRRFSISAGMRWEVPTPLTERYNRFATFDRDAPFPIKVPDLPGLKGVIRHAGQDGQPRGQFDSYYRSFGPRVGLSYSLGRKTAFRAGYGIFYAPRQGTTTATNFGITGAGATTTWVSTSNDGLTLQYPLSNPFPNGLVAPPTSPEALVQLGQSITVVDRRAVSNTYNQQWNFNLQRQFGNSLLIELGYAGNKGTHLPVGLQLNQLNPVHQSLGTGLSRSAPNPFYGLVSNGTLSLPTTNVTQLLRPYPQYVTITTAGSAATGLNIGDSSYHALQVKAQKRFSKGYSFLAAYTKSKLIDNSSGRLFGVSAFVPPVQNAYDLKAERSISEGDVSQQLVVTHTLDLPVGKGKRLLRSAPKPVDMLLGGWSASGTITLSAGFPLVLTSTGNSGVGGAILRPNNNGKSAKLEGPVQERLGRFFDTSVFSIPPSYTFGNTARSLPDTRSPGRRNYDFNLSKRFKATEKISVYLRGEAYNLTNTPYFYGPAVGLGSANFGVISRSSGDRQMQFSLKVLF